MARQHHCEQQGYVDDLERQLAEARQERALVSQEDERMRELLLQIKKEREEDRAAIRAFKAAILEHRCGISTTWCGKHGTYHGDTLCAILDEHAAAIARAARGGGK